MEESIRLILETVQRGKGEMDKALKEINKLNAANKQSTGIFASVNKVFSENTKLLRDLKIAAAAAAAAFVLMVKKSVDVADTMGKQAKQIGTTVEAYSRLTVAAELNEVSQQELFLGLNHLSRALVEAQTPGSKTADTFKELGFTSADLAKGLKDPATALLQVSEAFHTSEGAAVKAAFAQELFGRGGKAFVNFLDKGTAGIQQEAAAADALNVVFSGKLVGQADEFNDNLQLLKTAVTGLGKEVISILLPSLINFSNLLLDVARDGTTVKTVAQVIVAVFRTLAQVSTIVVGVFRFLALIIGQTLGLSFSIMEKEIQGSIELFLQFQTNIGKIINAVFNLVKSIGALGDVFSNLARGNFTGAATAARAAFGTISAAAEEVGKSVLGAFKGTGGIIAKTTVDIAGTIKDVTVGALDDIVKLAEGTSKTLAAISSDEVVGGAVPAAADKKPKRELKPGGAAKGTADLLKSQAKGKALDADLADQAAAADIQLGIARNLEAEILAATKLRLEAQAAEEAAAIADLAAQGITDEKLRQSELNNITQEGTLARIAIEQNARDKVKAIRDTQLQGTQTMFTNMATAAKSFGKEGFLAYKVFASAAALVDTYRGATAAYAAMAGIPYVGPVLGIVAAAAAVAAGLANVAAINAASFAGGGLVPGAPSNTDNRLAHVATGEYIFDARSVQALGPAYFAAMHAAIRSGSFTSAFAGGGLVPRPVFGSHFAAGGLVGTTGDRDETTGMGSVSLGFLDTRNQQREFQRRDGVKILIDQLQRRGNKVFA